MEQRKFEKLWGLPSMARMEQAMDFEEKPAEAETEIPKKWLSMQRIL